MIARLDASKDTGTPSDRAHPSAIHPAFDGRLRCGISDERPDYVNSGFAGLGVRERVLAGVAASNCTVPSAQAAVTRELASGPCANTGNALRKEAIIRSTAGQYIGGNRRIWELPSRIKTRPRVARFLVRAKTQVV